MRGNDLEYMLKDKSDLTISTAQPRNPRLGCILLFCFGRLTFKTAVSGHFRIRRLFATQ